MTLLTQMCRDNLPATTNLVGLDSNLHPSLHPSTRDIAIEQVTSPSSNGDLQGRDAPDFHKLAIEAVNEADPNARLDLVLRGDMMRIALALVGDMRVPTRNLYESGELVEVFQTAYDLTADQAKILAQRMHLAESGSKKQICTPSRDICRVVGAPSQPW